MQRITLSLTDDTAELFNRWYERRGYKNRSEAFRDMIRNFEAEDRFEENEGAHCAAVVSYVYNHHERQLAARMVEHQHQHGDVVHTVTHVHLNHEECLETVILFGHVKEVMAVADGILTEPGIRNGRVHRMPLDALSHCHQH